MSNFPYQGSPGNFGTPPDTSKENRTALLVVACVLLIGVVSLGVLWTTVLRTKLDSFNYYGINARGNAYAAKHDYPDAIKEYTRMIEARPNKDDGYLLRGIAEYKSGLYSIAVFDDTRGLQVISTSRGIREIGFGTETYAKKLGYLPLIRADLFVNRALSYDAMGRQRKAIGDYTSAIRNQPNDWQAHWNRADDNRQLHNWVAAISDANWLVARYPTRYSVYRERGLIYRDDGNSSAAEADFSQAINIHPDHFDLYYMRGKLYENGHQYAKAVDNWKQAATKLSGNADCWTDLGWAEYLAGDLKGCIASSREAISIKPRTPYPKFNVALCHAVLNDWGDAQREYRQALAGAPPSVVAGSLDDIHNALKSQPTSTALHNADALLTVSGKRG